jgi:hypothetical protein
MLYSVFATVFAQESLRRERDLPNVSLPTCGGKASAALKSQTQYVLCSLSNSKDEPRTHARTHIKNKSHYMRIVPVSEHKFIGWR